MIEDDELAIPAIYSIDNDEVSMTVDDCKLHLKYLAACRNTLYDRRAKPTPIFVTAHHIHYRIPRSSRRHDAHFPSTGSAAPPGRAVELATPAATQGNGAGGDSSVDRDIGFVAHDAQGAPHAAHADSADSLAPCGMAINGVPVPLPLRMREELIAAQRDADGDRLAVRLTSELQLHYFTAHDRIVAPGGDGSTPIDPGTDVEAIDMHQETIQILEDLGVVLQDDLFQRLDK